MALRPTPVEVNAEVDDASGVGTADKSTGVAAGNRSRNHVANSTVNRATNATSSGKNRAARAQRPHLP
jgi:hypothetical protein